VCLALAATHSAAGVGLSCPEKAPGVLPGQAAMETGTWAPSGVDAPVAPRQEGCVIRLGKNLILIWGSVQHCVVPRAVMYTGTSSKGLLLLC